MGELSDIEYHILAAISDNFIRLETLSGANDRVSNAIAKLPIFQYYNLGDVQKTPFCFALDRRKHTIRLIRLRNPLTAFLQMAKSLPNC